MHRYVDLHAKIVGALTRERAADRDRLGGVARHRDADQVLAGDQRVGRVELDPSGARQVDVGPGMGAAGALHAPTKRRIVEIAGDEARAEAERARRLDEQKSEVAAGAALALDRVERRLR